MLVLTEPIAQNCFASVPGAERLGERRDLDRVAEQGAGAVRLDVADRVGRHPGRGLGLPHHLGLAVDAGRRVAHLEGAVVVAGRALDHRVDVVAVGQRVGEALEHHHRRRRCR